MGYLLDISPKDLEKVLYFASSIITSVDKEAREEDLDELRDELAADLEELDAERDRLVESTRRQSFDYVPADDEFVDDIDENERLTPEEVEEEIADIYEEFSERKALRQEAFDAFQKIEPKQLIADEGLYREMRANYRDYFKGGMGAEAVRDLFEVIDLTTTAAELNDAIANGKGQKRAKAIKRLKVVDAFLKSNNKPSDMILDVIPVIPPDLRPMVQLDGGRFATSDLNDLYRRVINRNNRLKRVAGARPAPSSDRSSSWGSGAAGSGPSWAGARALTNFAWLVEASKSPRTSRTGDASAVPHRQNKHSKDKETFRITQKTSSGF